MRKHLKRGETEYAKQAEEQSDAPLHDVYDATSGQYIFNLSTKAGYTQTVNGASQTVSFAQGTYTLSISWTMALRSRSRSTS